MSKEKLVEIGSHIVDETSRFFVRWFFWLIVVGISALNRACYEYIKTNGDVSLRRLMVLFIMTLCSGLLGIFIISTTNYSVEIEAVFVVVFSIICFRIIDALINIDTKTYTAFLTKGIFAALDSWRDNKKTNDGGDN